MEQVPLPSAGLEPAWNADPLPFMQGLRPLSPFAPSAPAGLLASDCFQPAFPDLPCPAADLRVPVLVATGPRRASPRFGQGLLASRQRAGRMYEVACVQVNSLFELEARCRPQAPRLLLVDIALMAPESVASLDGLRRRFPATGWLLGWAAAAPQGLGAPLWSQARGSVEWAASAEQFAQSMDAVLAGTLGFPGPVVQALYLCVLRAKASGGRPASGGTAPALRLTAREDEVLSLMHRDMTNKQIAERLGISVNTVKKHLAHVFAKQGPHSRRWHLV